MIVIPARLASTRFKNKILCEFGGVPMFIKTAQNAAKADRVLIAVDEPQILKIAQDYGFDAVLTAREHQSGTDRIAEAVTNAALTEDEIIINIQADEPFFESENLIKFKDFANAMIAQKGAFMASCYKYISQQAAEDPNLVKLVLDNAGFAIYFSRSLIPYPRAACECYLGHIGIYAYSVRNLKRFCALPASALEDTEKLEQLRAISAGEKIAMLGIETASIGIDTPADYERALKEFGNGI